MAEATLNDVSNAIQQGNQKAESQQKFSEFNEYRRNKSSGKVLNSLVNEVKALMLPAEALVKEFKIFASAQIDFIKVMEAKFELDKERQASQARLKVLNPTKGFDLQGLGKMPGIFEKLYRGLRTDLSKLSKTLLDNKKGLLALAAGAVLAFAAFNPDWVKRNIQAPIADALNVLAGDKATTGLGRFVAVLKELFNVISGEEATTRYGRNIGRIKDFFVSIYDLVGPTGAIGLLLALKFRKLTAASLKGMYDLVTWAVKSGKNLRNFTGASAAADAAMNAGGGPPNRPKKLGPGPLARLGTAISNFGKNIATKATQIAVSSKDIIKNLGSMVGKAAGKTGGGLLRLGATLLRFGPAGAIALGIAGIAVAVDKLRDMNIDSTVKDISDKNAALKAAIASGNPKAIESTEKALQEALNKVKNTTLEESKRVSKVIKESLASLAIEAAKRQSQAFDSLNKKGELLAREAETIALVRDIKLGAVKAISGATKPLEEAKAQFKKIAGLNISQEDKDNLIKIIQGGLAQDGKLKRGQRLAIDKLFIDMETARLKRLEDKETARLKRLEVNDMFGEMTGKSSGLIYRSPEEVSHIKTAREVTAEIMGGGVAPSDQNLLKQQEMLARAGKGGFNNDVGGLNMPVLAPVTNNSDSRNMSVTTYNITNVFGGLTDPLEGFYGGPSPTRQ